MSATLAAAGAVVMSALAAGSAPAQSADQVKGWQFAWENDSWAKRPTDQWYTNGLRLSWTYDDTSSFEILRSAVRAQRSFFDKPGTSTLTYSIGQTMYTPRNIARATPQPFDRPWAGFLYFGVTAHTDSPRAFTATEVKVGMAGPASLAREVQSEWHRLIGSTPPLGWDNQLRDRPGLQLGMAHVRKFGDNLLDDRLGAQWGLHGAVGTLRTYAGATAALLVGDLTGAETPLLIGNEGDFVVPDFKPRAQFDKPFGYVAAGVTAVGFNHFLQGKTPYGASRIEPRRNYRMLQVGLSLPFHEWIGSGWPRLVYSQTVRTPEFTSERVREAEASQRWGMVTLNWTQR